jgi:predicted RND superfamily exporter protein
MGLLLVILMFLNMVDAMIFIPALVTVFKPKFVAEKKM